MEIKTIKDSVYSLDKNAQIHLFGSRIDDKKRGGDIDLIIISDKLKFADRGKIYASITRTMDEQKIDIIIYNGKDKNLFIEKSLKESLVL